MKTRRPFTIRQQHRAGIKRAAEWHDRMEGMLRDAIADRVEHGFNIYGELLWRAEEHERSAQAMRELLKPDTAGEGSKT